MGAGEGPGPGHCGVRLSRPLPHCPMGTATYPAPRHRAPGRPDAEKGAPPWPRDAAGSATRTSGSGIARRAALGACWEL